MRPNVCDICGLTDVAEQLVYGPVMSICKECVGTITRQMLMHSYHVVARPVDWDEKWTWYCSFCGKSTDDVKVLVEIKSSSHDCICDACVMICIDEIVAKYPKLQIPIKLNISQANN